MPYRGVMAGLSVFKRFLRKPTTEPAGEGLFLIHSLIRSGKLNTKSVITFSLRVDDAREASAYVIGSLVHAVVAFAHHDVTLALQLLAEFGKFRTADNEHVQMGSRWMTPRYPAIVVFKSGEIHNFHSVSPLEFSGMLRGARVDICTLLGKTEVHISPGQPFDAESHNETRSVIIGKLLEMGARVDFLAMMNNPVYRGEGVHVIHALVAGGWNCSAPFSRDYQKSPLHIAAHCIEADVVSCLLSLGADPNQRDDGGALPLHALFMDASRYLSYMNRRDSLAGSLVTSKSEVVLSIVLKFLDAGVDINAQITGELAPYERIGKGPEANHLTDMRHFLHTDRFFYDTLLSKGLYLPRPNVISIMCKSPKYDIGVSIFFMRAGCTGDKYDSAMENLIKRALIMSDVNLLSFAYTCDWVLTRQVLEDIEGYDLFTPTKEALENSMAGAEFLETLTQPCSLSQWCVQAIRTSVTDNRERQSLIHMEWIKNLPHSLRHLITLDNVDSYDRYKVFTNSQYCHYFI